MKTASKVFLIISKVSAIISLVSGSLVLLTSLINATEMILYSIFLLGYGIFATIICSKALKKLKTATSKSELTGIAIVTLIFVSLLGGIFMLCINENELNR